MRWLPASNVQAELRAFKEESNQLSYRLKIYCLLNLFGFRT